MCDYYGQGCRIEFSAEFEKSLTGLAALNGGQACLSEVEAELFRDVVTCLLEKTGRREIPLRGVTPTGIEHLKSMLARAGITTTYEPIRHHYRSPSEPARLVMV